MGRHTITHSARAIFFAAAGIFLASCSPKGPQDPSGTSPQWTEVDVGEAGARVSVPCEALDAPVSRQRDGAVRYTVRSQGCSHRGLRFEVDYWDDVALARTSKNAADLVADEVIRSAVGDEQGWVVDRQAALEGQAKGWFAFEVGLHRGIQHRIERHFLLLPRKVSVRVTGDRLLQDDPDVTRFLDSLELYEPSAIGGAQTGALTERRLELDDAAFFVTLPCMPTGDPMTKSNQEPLGAVDNKVLKCHHPTSNAVFHVLIAKADASRTAPLSNGALASRLANDATNAFQAETKAETHVDAPAADGEAAFVDFQLGAKASVGIGRFRVEYPYFASIVVLGSVDDETRATIVESLRLP